MGEIVDFDGITTLDINPDKILEGAKGVLESGMVIGWDKNDELYIGLSFSKRAEIVYLLEVVKQEIMGS